MGVTLAFLILIALAVCLTLACARGKRSSAASSGGASPYGTVDTSRVQTDASHVQMEESRNNDTA